MTFWIFMYECIGCHRVYKIDKDLIDYQTEKFAAKMKINYSPLYRQQNDKQYRPVVCKKCWHNCFKGPSITDPFFEVKHTKNERREYWEQRNRNLLPK